jgi:Bacterial PH domain
VGCRPLSQPEAERLSSVVFSSAQVVITLKRVVLASGMVLRGVNAIPLDKITDIEFRVSQAGRMLGYGQFGALSLSADPRMKTFKTLTYPAQL